MKLLSTKSKVNLPSARRHTISIAGISDFNRMASNSPSILYRQNYAGRRTNTIDCLEIKKVRWPMKLNREDVTLRKIYETIVDFDHS